MEARIALTDTGDADRRFSSATQPRVPLTGARAIVVALVPSHADKRIGEIVERTLPHVDEAAIASDASPTSADTLRSLRSAPS